MEEPQQTFPLPVKKKTACAECRQQKMRCDGNPGTSESQACSRCRRLEIPCVFSAPFKRTHKRKRLQELEEEVAALKRHQPSMSPVPSANPLTRWDGNAQPEDSSSMPRASAGAMRPEELPTDRDPTMWRTIDGLEVSPGIIDDCFRLYFKENHHLLPLLDPSISPNRFYQHVPFLFWVIISIGSRRYAEHPTLTQSLALPVTQLALQSITTRNNPIERIKGLILLLNWPFPSSAFYRDPSFLLAGILLHMSMQCGLNTPTYSQDFSKSYSRVTEQEHLSRAELWAYVVITYQMICSGSGQPNLVLFELCSDQIHLKTLLEKLPMSLRVRLRISNITSRSNKALLDLGLASMTSQQERTMDALLKGFSSELESLTNLTPSLSVWDRFYLAAAHQDLVVMQFYKSATTLDMQSCISIFSAASKVLELILSLDQDFALHRNCTRYIMTVTLLSLASLARILKGPFAASLDQAQGYNLIEKGITFVRSCSVQKGDFAAKCATFGEKLWKSKKIFRDADGSINITLRVRNRLSGGPIHDAIKCWIGEFSEPEFNHVATGISQEPAMPAGQPTQADTMLDPSSVTAVPTLATAPQAWLEDAYWGDMDLGLGVNWDLAGSYTGWTF